MNSALFVRCTGPDPKTMKIKHRSFFTVEAGKTTLSCSGFVAGRNVVLTSAWLLAPFVNESKPNSLIYDTKVDCCGEDGTWRKCELVAIWKGGQRVSKAVRELTNNDEDLMIRGITQYDIAVLSCDTNGLSPVAASEASFFDVRATDRGASLAVVSSAFGLVSPTVFRNSVTKGVLSNVVLTGSASTAPPDLCLTDARCLAGSEGAPVFDSKNRFLGMVLPGLLRKDGLQLELGVILPFYLFWNDCLKLLSSSSPLSGSSPSSGGNAESSYKRVTASPSASLASSVTNSTGRSPAAVPSVAAQSVALIRVGTNWGSGVLIHRNPQTGDGIVLTCAHVVKPHFDTAEAISVSFRGVAQPVDRIGTVRYCCEGPVDIAFVGVSRLPAWLDPAALVRSPDELQDGDMVSAVGHAIFEPAGLLGRNATVSTGTLSRVVKQEGRPALLQTCAQVFRGHSGGMVCDSQGRLVGIITSNARHSDGSIIPEINFAVPVSFLDDVLEEGLAEPSSLPECAKRFDERTKSNAQLRMLWALQPVESVETPPRIGGGNFYSFFARFLESKL